MNIQDIALAWMDAHMDSGTREDMYIHDSALACTL